MLLKGNRQCYGFAFVSCRTGSPLKPQFEFGTIPNMITVPFSYYGKNRTNFICKIMYNTGWDDWFYSQARLFIDAKDLTPGSRSTFRMKIQIRIQKAIECVIRIAYSWRFKHYSFFEAIILLRHLSGDSLQCIPDSSPSKEQHSSVA